MHFTVNHKVRTDCCYKTQKIKVSGKEKRKITIKHTSNLCFKNVKIEQCLVITLRSGDF